MKVEINQSTGQVIFTNASVMDIIHWGADQFNKYADGSFKMWGRKKIVPPESYMLFQQTIRKSLHRLNRELGGQ